MSCTCGGDCGCGCATPCAAPPTTLTIDNPSGLPQLAYRVGDFTTFRRALLAHLPGEVELAPWRPVAGTDLGLQVLDWWAYIADVLTFYNERIANEDYLGTAQLQTSVQHLVALLGYRPRPGIGATATLAVEASKPAPVVIPAGLAIGSNATPQVPAQTFETSTATTFDPPTTVPTAVPDDLTTPPASDAPPDGSPAGFADAPGHDQLIARGGALVQGTPSVAVGDQLMLMSKDWASADDPAVMVTVTGTGPEKDPYGRKNTRVLLAGADALASASATDFTLVRATRTAHLATLPSNATVISATQIVLDSPARYLAAGQALLVAMPGATPAIVRLDSYSEEMWYLNAAPDTPTTPPANNPMPSLVAALSVSASAGANLAGFQSGAASVTVSSGWVSVGMLLATPAATLAGVPSVLTLAAPPLAPAGIARAALLEDADGIGAAISATPQAGSTRLSVTAADDGAPLENLLLKTPVRVLWDLITVSRGATVSGETLGTGDATLAGQDFALAKTPVTYLADEPGRSGDGYSSTISIAVDGRYWSEVPSLYGYAADAAIFETYEDDDGKTHVRFGGDGAGRRLPSGAQVVASYRTGSGAAVPAPGSLTQILTAVPNLNSVYNPVPPVGGADPQPANATRTLAPRSVLTFGRAISGGDYTAVAAAAPGVSRAAAAWEWDAAEQRPMVRVYVGDDAGALDSAKNALAKQADPNRPFAVVAAVACPAVLTLSLRIDATFVADDVRTAVSDALIGVADPDSGLSAAGLFAPGVLDLGETLYRSRIEEVVCAVPGILAAHALHMSWVRNGVFYDSDGPRFDPGDGGFFTLPAGDLSLGEEVADGD